MCEIEKSKENLTEYRTINNGWREILQYKSVSDSFWGGTKTEWKVVPKPYYDEIWGNGLFKEDDPEKCITGDYACESFVKKYPNISVYLEQYKIKQAALEDEVHKLRRAREEKKKQVKYFTKPTDEPSHIYSQDQRNESL